MAWSEPVLQPQDVKFSVSQEITRRQRMTSSAGALAEAVRTHLSLGDRRGLVEALAAYDSAHERT